MHCVKKLHLVVDSSMEVECIASSKAGESVAYARECLRVLGESVDEPTIILTDNQANLLVASNATSASKSRHFLRRYWALQQRLAQGECCLTKIEDANMPADFLTKWLPAAKLRKSVDCATNARAAGRGGD